MYSVGFIFSLISFLIIGRILVGKRDKEQEYTSHSGSGSTFFPMVIGLVFIGAGLFVETQFEIVSIVFGVDFSRVFGDLTPLVRLVLNPFFMIGMLVIINSVNNLLVAMQLNNQGTLTIPYEMQITRDRDSDGDTYYDVKYYYLDDYRGTDVITEDQFRSLGEKVDLIVSDAAQPQDVVKAFLVQYLESDPTYHRFCETKNIPGTLMDANKAVLTEELQKEPRPVRGDAPADDDTYGIVEQDEYFMNPDDDAQPDELPPM